MNPEGRQPIDGALSPVPAEFCPGGLERLREESGLTWRGLASRLSVNDRRRLELRLPAGPGRQGIVALARDLSGGCGLATAGKDACDQNGNPDHHGHGG